MSQPRYRPYPEYKNSGVDWLGEIPAHWEMRRLKFAASIDMGQSPSSEECNLEGKGPPFLQGNAEFGERHPIPKMFCPTASKRALPGDLLLSVRAPVGELNVADQPYGIGRGLCSITPRKGHLNRGFAWYLIQVTRTELDSVATGSTYDAVSTDEVKDMLCLLPSPPEQRAIAAFLDRQTARLDALVAEQRRLIELLQERRAALISRAVTQGLDPSAPLTDSGIPWLGEIPAHWEAISLKFAAKREPGAIKTGPFGSQLLSSEMMEGEIKVYNQRNVIDRDLVQGDNYISKEKYEELQTFTVYPGDVLVTTRGTIGQCMVVPDDAELGILHPCLMRIQPDPERLLDEFLILLIQDSFLVQNQLLEMSNATTIEVIYSDTMRQVRIPLPPIQEQRTIAACLDRETAQIDAAVAEIETGIAHLEEYRTALVSAAVTGKIDVRCNAL